MKEYVLNYYSKFKCLANLCKHTCCAGWEMDIDQTSLDSYKREKSSYSSALKKGIDFKKSKFKCDKNKRCAFLNNKDLCEIIINLGEERLCQVCRDHPRFRSFFSDRVETGLGFCCEEATRIILSFEGEIQAVKLDKGEDEGELDFNEKNILEFRKKALAILQNRSATIDERIEGLLKECKADVSESDFYKTIKKLLSLESVNKSWKKRLKSIKGQPFNKLTENDLSHYAEQFLANSIYRHLSDAEDTISVRIRAIACVIAWWIIKSIIEKEQERNKDNFEIVIDVIREYSVEIEYSEKNLQKLFNFAEKLIKI